MRSALKDFIISTFPFIYRHKHFAPIDKCNFDNYGEFHQEAELLLLPYLLKEGSDFIDIGSNRGDYIYKALKSTTPIHVHAFEPNPLLFKKLKAVFSGIHLYPIALSSAKTNSRLSVPYTNGHPDDSLGKLGSFEAGDHAMEFDIVTDLLDSFKDKIQKPGLIKIDVEGHEMAVLKGAIDTLSRHHPVLIVEIEQRHHSSDIRAMINAFCHEMNYSCYNFDPNHKCLIEFDSEKGLRQEVSDLGTPQFINNFIFLPKHGEYVVDIAAINSKITAHEN